MAKLFWFKFCHILRIFSMLPLPDPLAVTILVTSIVFILLLVCFICQSRGLYNSHKCVKDRRKRSKKFRQNIEFCIRFNAEKKSISEPKSVKSLDPVYSGINKTRFDVPRKLGKPWTSKLKSIPCLFKRMDNWHIIRLNTLKKELNDLEEVISKINLDGIYSNGGFHTKLNILYRQIEVLKSSLDRHECTCWQWRDISKALSDFGKFVFRQYLDPSRIHCPWFDFFECVKV